MSHSDPLAMTRDCHRWDEPLSLLAAGCLDASLEPRLRRHLVACPRCARDWEDRARLARRLTAAAPREDGHAAAIEGRLADAIIRPATNEPAAMRSHERRRHRGWFILWGVATAASVAILRLAAGVGRLPSPAPEPAAVSPVAVGATAENPGNDPPPSMPPIFVAHELALARSDAAFDDVLRRHSVADRFGSSEPPFLTRRLAQEIVR